MRPNDWVEGDYFRTAHQGRLNDKKEPVTAMGRAPRQLEQLVQRPWGRSELMMSKEQKEGRGASIQ